MTTGAGWTPGPWEAAYEDGKGHVVRLGDAITSPGRHASHHLWMCEHCIDPGEEPPLAAQFAQAEANAHLIAAAPLLYEALMETLDALATDNEAMVEWQWRVVAQANVVLAGARGEFIEPPQPPRARPPGGPDGERGLRKTDAQTESVEAGQLPQEHRGEDEFRARAEGREAAARVADEEQRRHEDDALVYDGQGTPRAAERARLRASACQGVATRIRSLSPPSPAACQHVLTKEAERCRHGFYFGSTCEACIRECAACWDGYSSAATFCPRPSPAADPREALAEWVAAHDDERRAAKAAARVRVREYAKWPPLPKRMPKSAAPMSSLPPDEQRRISEQCEKEMAPIREAEAAHGRAKGRLGAAIDRARALTALDAPAPRPDTPPCGGARCWRTPDGTSWVHAGPVAPCDVYPADPETIR